MLRSSRIQLSYLQHIPPDQFLGTRSLVVRRHRSGPSKRSKPNLQTLQRLLDNNSEPTPRTGLDNLVPFGSRQQQHQQRRPPYNQQHQQHHIPHEQQHRPFLPHQKPFRPPQGRNAYWDKVYAPSFPDIADANVTSYFEDNVKLWANALTTSNRMISFGFDAGDSRKLLRAFAKDVMAHRLSDAENATYYGLERFGHHHHIKNVSIDEIYSTIFFSWAADPAVAEELEKNTGVRPDTLELVHRLVAATSRPYPADEFPGARTIRRKVILHVGPTNSGKTHHALRALSAADSGVYAGPLRLLAHEIWDRLNTGKIVPLGVEASPADFTGNGNPKYAVPCHMVTGEERKYVPNARLLSCTVEMLPFFQTFDVAVVDEIQLINDPERGFGWANAVYGLRAKELHLCGEEAAVPIVQKLLQHTGDEIIVKRYERLTPLVVEKKGLGGSLKNVKKGDCIVTFSRNSIFKVKKTVEQETGLKCAVVYGRLPPEVRNEQAALFNNPDSDYDVIIGSDAIGMGLNLKIQRVIFEAMHKYSAVDGGRTPLSISSVKQIAGRAGRYGLHKGKIDLGGTTTTLNDDDLPLLSQTIGLPNRPLAYAHLDVRPENLSSVLSILPSGTSMETATQACRYIGRLPSYCRYTSMTGREPTYKFIDKEWSDMSVGDKLTILNAPVPWRDTVTADLCRRLLHIHADESSVRLEHIMKGHDYMRMTEEIEKSMNEDMTKGEAAEGAMEDPPSSSLGGEEPVENDTKKSSKKGSKKPAKKQRKFVNAQGLMSLEILHKVLVFYIWMAFRNPVVYSDVNEVMELKERVEKVLNWTLSQMSTGALAQTPNSHSQPPSASETVKDRTLPLDSFHLAACSKQVSNIRTPMATSFS